MPYKDPEKRRQSSRESHRRWKERMEAAEPGSVAEYYRKANKRWRDQLTREQRDEMNRKQLERKERSGWVRKTPQPRPARMATRQAEPRIPVADNPADPRHGTLNAYKNHACRCDRCKLANREWQRAYMAMRREARDAT